MQSTSTRSTSAARELPYDILQEIFLHCLPASPLDEVQPNMGIAPMLLCHICSFWRIIALETPRLWAYLYCRLPLHCRDERLVAWDSKIFRRDMECLEWWRANQGSRAPFIRFVFYLQMKETSIQAQELPLTHDDIQFFVEYLSTAQYLDVGRFAVYLFQQDPIRSRYEALYPNIHSLVTRYPNSDEIFNNPYLFSFYIAPTLQRLRLYDVKLRTDYLGAFADWSGLTHLSLHNIVVFIDDWFSLIRAVPNLQWGYFDIFFKTWTNNDCVPPEFALPHLDTLFITVDNSSVMSEEEPLGQLLKHLHLPTLRDLSIYIDIYIDVNHWTPHDVAININDGLTFAPAITKLTLVFQFPGLSFTKIDVPQTSWEAVAKLSIVAPRLAHLVLDMCYMHSARD